MRFLDLITKKKRGESLTKAEIDFFIEGYQKGEIPDYQVSALMMAIYFQKMTHEETVNLTLAMAESGERVDLSSIPGIKVDKHSTGGVGDKTTLIISPIVAALGVKVAKMSGRGLGHTGGTIDKLEAIPGLDTAMSLEHFFRQVSGIGLAIAGQTANLAPADKKLYALRDVTGTVENMSLIAASILSKKIASGADKVAFDVKCGSGAFMKTKEEASELAQIMRDIGQSAGLEVHAIVSNMDQPLGRMVGNLLEVYEVVQCLKGEGPSDLMELCSALATEMLVLSEQYERSACQSQIEAVISDGRALEKLREMIAAQGGDNTFVDNLEAFFAEVHKEELLAETSGFIRAIESETVGLASSLLGAGRSTIEDVIDPVAGLVFEKKVGDYVEKGDVICTLYTSDATKLSEAKAKLYSSIKIQDGPVKLQPIILEKFV